MYWQLQILDNEDSCCEVYIHTHAHTICKQSRTSEYQGSNHRIATCTWIPSILSLFASSIRSCLSLASTSEWTGESEIHLSFTDGPLLMYLASALQFSHRWNKHVEDNNQKKKFKTLTHSKLILQMASLCPYILCVHSWWKKALHPRQVSKLGCGLVGNKKALQCETTDLLEDWEPFQILQYHQEMHQPENIYKCYCISSIILEQETKHVSLNLNSQD